MQNELTKAIYKIMGAKLQKPSFCFSLGVSDVHATSYSSLTLLMGLTQLRI